MDRLHDVATLLVSSWIISGGKARIPTSHGLLDRALRDAQSHFPEWARAELHFVDSRVGLQCVELPEILGAAQSAELTSAPNPSYRYAEATIDDWAAKILLHRLKVSELQARELGESLRKGVAAAQQRQSEFERERAAAGAA